MKKLITILVTIWLTISGIIAGITGLIAYIIKAVKIEELDEVREGFEKNKKEIVIEILYVIFCWPWIIIKNLKNLMKVAKEFDDFVKRDDFTEQIKEYHEREKARRETEKEKASEESETE